ncbi:MAG: caspase family protein, partial [Alphaproteobacteria bacterium]
MSLRRLFALSLTFSFLSLAVAVDASASKRVALVVGNNDYTTLAALNNAEKDARDMAQMLRGLGWEVVDLYNSSLRDTGRAISKFEGLLMTAEA